MEPSQLKELPRSERVERIFDFEPTDYQSDLLDYGESKRKARAAVKPGRQVGKTLTGAAIAADYALTNANVDVLIAAPFQDTADEMMREAKKHLTRKFTKDQLGVIDDNKREWEFANGTRLISATAGVDGSGLRGKNPKCVVFDEAHYQSDVVFEEVIPAFFATHNDYEYYLFSTPRGKQGYFYRAVDGDLSEEWYSPHWPSEISPFVSDDEIERNRKQLDRITFAQEWLGEFREEGDALFPRDTVEPCLGDPELSGRKWLGVDIAREGKDRTVYTEIDEHGNARVADSEETSTMDGVLGRIRDLHTENDYVSIIVEENSMGGGVVDFGNDLRNVMQPFKTSTKSKHQLYKQLQRDIEGERLTLENHRRLITELTSLQYEFTQHGYMKVSHPEGGHDDFPDSLAFANWGRSGGQGQVTRRKARSTVSHNTNL